MAGAMLSCTLRTQLQTFLQEKKINLLSHLSRREASTVACSPPYYFFLRAMDSGARDYRKNDSVFPAMKD